MQIDRRFEIIYLLLNAKYKTVKDLALHFEVSTRTIYRDIEALSSIGIPIYTNKGRGGGVHILDNFILNKSFLTEKEQNNILSSLQSLSVTNYPEIKDTLGKLKALFNKDISNWIDVDFSDWSDKRNDYFNILKNSIFEKSIISFDYFGTRGVKTKRRVEPIQLMYKDKSWYLHGFCLEKQEYRMFKLNRIKNLTITEDHFLERAKEEIKLETNKQLRNINLKFKIDKSLAYRVYDEFNEDQIDIDDDGDFIIKVSFIEDNWVFGYILSFGENIEVLEPEYIREIIAQKLGEALKKYL